MTTGGSQKLWVPFKYKGLPVFCFGCGKMGHDVRDCETTPDGDQNLPKEDFPYSITLKAESNVRGKEYRGLSDQKDVCPKNYVGKGASGMIVPVGVLI